MIFQSPARFIVIVVLTVTSTSSAYAENAGRLSDRIFNFVDKNRDGNIDKAEFQAMPASMRAWMEKKGKQPAPSISKTDFLAVFPQMMTDLRGPRGNGSPGPSAPTNAKPTLYATKPPEGDDIVVTPVSSELPSEYQESDLDRDGQIDFFEWRKSNRAKSEFKQRDLNGDSVLSARELGGEATAVASSGTSSNQNSTTSDPKPAAPSIDLTDVPYEKLPASEQQEYVKILKTYFNYLDSAEGTGNKDGKLQEKEWDASQRIKPIFVNAKVDIKKDMTESEFVTHYTKLVNTKDPTWLLRVKASKKNSEKSDSSSRDEKASKKEDKRARRGDRKNGERRR